ncbi:MAG: tRNA (adenosine(37)-N6)-threonylcarbamoyltransferase complex ATPase subunit type 1 TsaE [Saprospiraceae bacterium]
MSNLLFTKEYSLDELESTSMALMQFVSKPCIVIFIGDLGAGKTTMIKALCSQLGYASDVTSPTFSLVNEYRMSEKSVIYHMDLYRLKSPNEALDFGFDEYLFDPDAYSFIEWPEIVLSLIPTPYYEIKIQHSGDGLRQLALIEIADNL